jgi:hypothetical protein
LRDAVAFDGEGGGNGHRAVGVVVLELGHCGG